jgi:hypothetical protein
MTEVYTFDMFSKELGTRFRMHYGQSETADLELISAKDISPTPRHPQFSLIFLGPESCPISQQIYELEHETLGTMNIFLVPIGKDSRGVEYEAVFNRTA